MHFRSVVFSNVFVMGFVMQISFLVGLQVIGEMRTYFAGEVALQIALHFSQLVSTAHYHVVTVETI